jgi:hypothetical protein
MGLLHGGWLVARALKKEGVIEAALPVHRASRKTPFSSFSRIARRACATAS